MRPMLPIGLTANDHPRCVALIEGEPDLTCGSLATLIGANDTGFHGCFCGECAEVIGDVFPNWSAIGAPE